MAEPLAQKATRHEIEIETEIEAADVAETQPEPPQPELAPAIQAAVAESAADVVERPLNEQFETFETTELPEIQSLEVEFEVDEEFIFEVPKEPVDEGLLIIQQEQQPLNIQADRLEPEELALASLEIEDEIQQAALLWAENLAIEEEATGENSTNPEDLRDVPVTIIELLPIEPEILIEKLQKIPEEKLQEAAAILEVIMQTAQRVEQNEDIDETDIELVTAGLEQMVERLLTCLEIEHDKKHVALIVQALLSGEINLDFEAILARQDEGTHERKYVSAWIMAVLKQQTDTKQIDHSFIGKYVMQLSFSETQLNWAA